MADRLELTMIEAGCDDADTFFPEIDQTVWKTVGESPVETDPKSGVSYRFVTLRRV